MLQTNIKRPLVIAGIVVGLSLVLGIGGSWALASYINSEVAAVSAARIEAARIATLGPRLATLKSQEAEADAYARVISLLLPTQEQLLEMPRVIESVGNAHSVSARLSFVGSGDPAATEIGATLPFALTATGAPANLAEFLRDIEIQNPRYTISISSADIAGSAAEPSTSKLNASGVVYYQ